MDIDGQLSPAWSKIKIWFSLNTDIIYPDFIIPIWNTGPNPIWRAGLNTAKPTSDKIRLSESDNLFMRDWLFLESKCDIFLKKQMWYSSRDRQEIFRLAKKRGNCKRGFISQQNAVSHLRRKSLAITNPREEFTKDPLYELWLAFNSPNIPVSSK